MAGPELDGFTVDEPAASVRLLLPASRRSRLVMPAWNGNEFLLPDGRRPIIRTFTPLRVDADALRARHRSRRARRRASRRGGRARRRPAPPAAISGPGRGYTIDRDAPAFLLGRRRDRDPRDQPVARSAAAGRRRRRCTSRSRTRTRASTLPDAPATRSSSGTTSPPGAPPGDALVAAVRATELVAGTRVWVAGEAAAVQRIRRHLFDERGIPRAQTTIRGYWKHGRAGSRQGYVATGARSRHAYRNATTGSPTGDDAILATCARSAPRLVERLRRRVGLQHPQVQARRRRPRPHGRALSAMSWRADATALQVVRHVQVVDEGAPFRVVVEDGVDEADHHTVTLGHDRAAVGLRKRQALRPHGAPVLVDVAVEELVGVRATIVAPPAVGMEPGNGGDVVDARLPESHLHERIIALETFRDRDGR